VTRLLSIPALTIAGHDEDPASAVQWAVRTPSGALVPYGDQEWVRTGQAAEDAEAGTTTVHRDVTITYGPWSDETAGHMVCDCPCTECVDGHCPSCGASSPASTETEDQRAINAAVHAMQDAGDRIGVEMTCADLEVLLRAALPYLILVTPAGTDISGVGNFVVAVCEVEAS
jgi:hypothetical protein